MSGDKILKAISEDEHIMIDMIGSPYSSNKNLKKLIYERGL